MEVVVFVGVQGAGKSSFFLERFVDTHVRINLDMLRTRHRERVLFEACLACRQSCVIDNTNPTPEDRARYLGPAKASGAAVRAFHFRVPVELALARNATREGRRRVADKGVYATARRLVPPSFSEGFDSIAEVVVGDEGTVAVEELAPADEGAPAHLR